MVREAGDSLEPFPGFGCQTDVAGVRPGFDFGQSLVAPAEKEVAPAEKEVAPAEKEVAPAEKEVAPAEKEKDEVRHQTATIILTVATRLPISVP
jgi:hypothetical protein